MSHARVAPMGRTLRIAVVSDLHAYDESNEDPPPSHLSLALPEDNPGVHPISGLIQLIRNERLHSDLLFCCGDMGDKARPQAIAYAWKMVHKLRRELKSKSVIATVGNHDVDSRYKYNKYDAKGVLQTLVPRYPLAKEALNDKFWARNFASVRSGQYRIISLNSSAFHGASDKEYLHGRISEYTLASLKKALSEQVTVPVNILICHHHPQKHQDVELEDYSIMVNGQPLLDLLGSGEHGSWLVVHGHKHHPKLAYSAGGSAGATILSAGSLCGTIYPELQGKARNQFYIITLPVREFAKHGFVGTVEAWDWAPGDGWAPAGPASGLPAKSGFGYRVNLPVLARQVSTFAGSRTTSWENLAKQFSFLRYVIPQDLAALGRELLRAHELRVTFDSFGAPLQIGRAL